MPPKKNDKLNTRQLAEMMLIKRNVDRVGERLKELDQDLERNSWATLENFATKEEEDLKAAIDMLAILQSKKSGQENQSKSKTRAEIVCSIMDKPSDFRDRSKVKMLATALDEAGIKPYTPREKLGSITLLDTSESFMEISNKRSDSQLYRRFFDPRNGSLVKDLRKKK